MLTSEEVQGLDPEIDILIDNEDPDKFLFIMKSGPYKGVAYVYTEVNIVPNEDPNTCVAQSHMVEFSFAPIENPNQTELDEAFQQKIGDLLVKMIDVMVDKDPA